jgi:shikimate kinase
MNLVLIGFMGTGKTTIGEKLSEKLDLNFFDTDRLIEEKENKTISNIFKRQAEKYFRKIESEVIHNLCSKEDNLIISCGGGVVLDDTNMKELKKKGKIILLVSSLDEILNRIANDNSRPLLKGNSKKVKDLFYIREKIYNKYFDIKIDTTNLNIQEVVNKLIKILGDKKW